VRIPQLCHALVVESDAGAHTGRYQWFGWTVPAAAGDASTKHLIELHEEFHRALDEMTAFGGLVTTVAALAQADPDSRWPVARDRLQAMSDIVHETYAVGMSLIVGDQRLATVDGYPLYDRYVAIANSLIGADTHLWVGWIALQAAITACMQSNVLTTVLSDDLSEFDPACIERSARPNHRLVALLDSDFAAVVAAANEDALREHGREDWWREGHGRSASTSLSGGVDEAALALRKRMFGEAAAALRATGATVIAEGDHYTDLAELLKRAAATTPRPLVPTGAMTELPYIERVLYPLDRLTITPSDVPARATLLPYHKGSGFTREGAHRHGFLTLVRTDYLSSSYELHGLPVPEVPAIACLRRTVHEGRPDAAIQHMIVAESDPLQEENGHPIYVSVTNSAAVAAPQLSSHWMRRADLDRLSLVMDTPVTPLIRRWCEPEGVRFRVSIACIEVADMEMWVIAGRVERSDSRSPLVIIPASELGTHGFEAFVEEEAPMRDAVVIDDELFQEERIHIGVVLNHLLREEHMVGPGRWL
jgi:hypothetical protein